MSERKVLLPFFAYCFPPSNSFPFELELPPRWVLDLGKVNGARNASSRFWRPTKLRTWIFPGKRSGICKCFTVPNLCPEKTANQSSNKEKCQPNQYLYMFISNTVFFSLSTTCINLYLYIVHIVVTILFLKKTKHMYTHSSRTRPCPFRWRSFMDRLNFRFSFHWYLALTICSNT